MSYDCFFGNVVGHCSDNFPPPPQTNTLSNSLLAVSYLSGPFSLMKTLVLYNTVLTSGLHYRSKINELMKISTIKALLNL